MTEEVDLIEKVLDAHLQITELIQDDNIEDDGLDGPNLVTIDRGGDHPFGVHLFQRIRHGCDNQRRQADS